MSDVDERVALVTGAGRGIGEAIASALHANGAVVYLLDADRPSAEAAAAKLGEGAQSLIGDMRERAQVESAVRTILREHGQLDILVNNAARTVNKSVGRSMPTSGTMCSTSTSVAFSSHVRLPEPR